MLEMKERMEGDLEILPNAARSYGDISSGAISSDLILLFGGQRHKLMQDQHVEIVCYNQATS